MAVYLTSLVLMTDQGNSAPKVIINTYSGKLTPEVNVYHIFPDSSENPAVDRDGFTDGLGEPSEVSLEDDRTVPTQDSFEPDCDGVYHVPEFDPEGLSDIEIIHRYFSLLDGVILKVYDDVIEEHYNSSDSDSDIDPDCDNAAIRREYLYGGHANIYSDTIDEKYAGTRPVHKSRICSETSIHHTANGIYTAYYAHDHIKLSASRDGRKMEHIFPIIKDQNLKKGTVMLAAVRFHNFIGLCKRSGNTIFTVSIPDHPNGTEIEVKLEKVSLNSASGSVFVPRPISTATSTSTTAPIVPPLPNLNPSNVPPVPKIPPIIVPPTPATATVNTNPSTIVLHNAPTMMSIKLAEVSAVTNTDLSYSPLVPEFTVYDSSKKISVFNRYASPKTTRFPAENRMIFHNIPDIPKIELNRPPALSDIILLNVPAMTNIVLSGIPEVPDITVSSIFEVSDISFTNIPSTAIFTFSNDSEIPKITLSNVPGKINVTVVDIQVSEDNPPTSSIVPENGATPSKVTLPDLPASPVIDIFGITKMSTIILSNVPAMEKITITNIPGVTDVSLSDIPDMSTIMLENIPPMAKIVMSEIPGSPFVIPTRNAACPLSMVHMPYSIDVKSTKYPVQFYDNHAHIELGDNDPGDKEYIDPKTNVDLFNRRSFCIIIPTYVDFSAAYIHFPEIFREKIHAAYRPSHGVYPSLICHGGWALDTENKTLTRTTNDNWPVDTPTVFRLRMSFPKVDNLLAPTSWPLIQFHRCSVSNVAVNSTEFVGVEAIMCKSLYDFELVNVVRCCNFDAFYRHIKYRNDIGQSEKYMFHGHSNSCRHGGISNLIREGFKPVYSRHNCRLLKGCYFSDAEYAASFGSRCPEIFSIAGEKSLEGITMVCAKVALGNVRDYRFLPVKSGSDPLHSENSNKTFHSASCITNSAIPGMLQRVHAVYDSDAALIEYVVTFKLK